MAYQTPCRQGILFLIKLNFLSEPQKVAVNTNPEFIEETLCSVKFAASAQTVKTTGIDRKEISLKP